MELACNRPDDLTWLVILIIKYDIRQCMGEMNNEHIALVGRPEGKRPATCMA